MDYAEKRKSPEIVEWIYHNRPIKGGKDRSWYLDDYHWKKTFSTIAPRIVKKEKVVLHTIDFQFDNRLNKFTF